MKKQNKILLIGIACLLIAGILIIVIYNNDIDKYVENLTYEKFEEKVENKESFVLFIGSKNCNHCAEFLPTFKRALKEVGVVAYYIDTASFTKEQLTYLHEVVDYEGTPTVVFITEGQENTSQKLVGSGHSMNKVIERLEKAGFVK